MSPPRGTFGPGFAVSSKKCLGPLLIPGAVGSKNTINISIARMSPPAINAVPFIFIFMNI
jgi:hypothetical protein